MIWSGDFERHLTDEERELAHSHKQFRDGKRVSALYDNLAAQGRRDAEVEDGVGNERPTYVSASAAKKLKGGFVP